MAKKLMCLKGVLILTIIIVLTGLSSAAEFPTKPIEWITSWGLGTVTSMTMQVVGDAMSKQLGKPVLVISAPGGGGIVGAYKAVRAKPDGYTLYLSNSASNGSVFYIKKEVPYRNSDFEHIAQIGGLFLALIVKPNSPFKTLEEYIEYVRKNPFVIKHATLGFGTSTHMCLELLKIEAGGLKVEMVPFKNAAELRTSVLGGHVDSTFVYGGTGGTADELRQTLDGGGRILAVTSKQRLKPYPDVPTFVEKGLNVVYSSWYGISVPKGLSKEVYQKLKDVIYKVLKDPQIIETIERIGLKYEFRDSEGFNKFIEEFEKITKRIVEEAKIPKE